MSTYGESVWDMGSIGHHNTDDVRGGGASRGGRADDGRADVSADGTDPFLAARALIACVDPQTSW